VGHPESICPFVVEGDRRGFIVPSITTIANLLRGRSRPDMDQDMRTLQKLWAKEDRTARLERDLANCQSVLVESMGDGTDFPRVELEEKQLLIVEALQAQRVKDRKNREVLMN